MAFRAISPGFGYKDLMLVISVYCNIISRSPFSVENVLTFVLIIYILFQLYIYLYMHMSLAEKALQIVCDSLIEF